ncbi:winged helix-turn-helix transcriptional regulator [Streptosporangium sp. NPDC050855]|uniref:winged helix-turn-helix transcriptional regulator n=1 Tax=Streptosporangium sp. NPDC050855 TaxID=3366194 RepID=UPI0037B28C7D
MDTIANKWTCLLVDALQDGPVRFGVLRRRLDGITQKSLTQTLRAMERDGMVIRTVYPTIPPRVEYGLSSLGHSVVRLMNGVRTWCEENVAEIVTSRTAYDLRAAEEPEPVRQGWPPARRPCPMVRRPEVEKSRPPGRARAPVRRRR